MNSKVTESIIYIGVNDHEVDLFEGQYIVPNGMAYNSYAIIGDKVAIMDTTDQKKTGEWLQNIDAAIKCDAPDYLIVQHMEPDHSASIQAFVEKYPNTTVVGNKKTFKMIEGDTSYEEDLERGGYRAGTEEELEDYDSSSSDFGGGLDDDINPMDAGDFGGDDGFDD